MRRASRTSRRSSSGTDKQGTPILVKNLAHVTLGPEIRRGIADLDGEGDTVGGIVIMRAGENALNVIERVKEKLEEIKPSLPKGVEIVTTYDRSELIERSIDTLKEELVDGNHHRQPGHPDFPLAHPFGDHPHPDDSRFPWSSCSSPSTSWG